MSRSNKQALIGMAAIAVVLIGIAVIATMGNNRRGLRVDVLSTRRAEPGEEVAITVSARDTDGAVTRVVLDFGDGEKAEPITKEPPDDCETDFGETEKFDFRHTYTGQGIVTVRATVTSGGCGTKDETVQAIRSIDIKPLRVR